MFWETLLDLCNKNQETPNGLCAKLGLSSATATKWKKGAVPRAGTIKKIADYFGVPMSHFGEDANIYVAPKDVIEKSILPLPPGALDLFVESIGASVVDFLEQKEKQPTQSELSEKQKRLIKIIEGMSDDQLDRFEKILAVVESTEL